MSFYEFIHKNGRLRTLLYIAALTIGIFYLSLQGEYYIYMLSLWAIYVISLLGLDLLIGYIGLFSLGHGAFMLIGGYATAIAFHYLALPWSVAAVFGLAISGLLGVVIGFVALRIRFLSFAILTFALASMLYHLVRSFIWTGGPMGIFFSPAQVANSLPTDKSLLFLSFGCLVLVSLMYSNISTGRSGSILKMIHYNEQVSTCFGISGAKYKIFICVVASAIAGLSGALLTLVTQSSAPDNYNPMLSIMLFGAVMIGGRGSLSGAFWGASLLVVLPELTQGTYGLGEVIYASIFLIIMIVEPDGIAGVLRKLSNSIYRKKVAVYGD